MPSIEDSKCVLVTGATAGIGRALALAIADLPNKPKVIGTGRRQERLQEISVKCDTMALEMDSDGETLAKAAADILANYPDVGLFPSYDAKLFQRVYTSA
jgi:NADP-dependent 3-hydroxy acid dehydrogenase YdfG